MPFPTSPLDAAAFDKELERYRTGKHFTFDNVNFDWWSRQSKSGLLAYLIEEELPVMVKFNGHVFFFGHGLDPKKISDLMRAMYGRMLSGRK